MQLLGSVIVKILQLPGPLPPDPHKGSALDPPRGPLQPPWTPRHFPLFFNLLLDTLIDSIWQNVKLLCTQSRLVQYCTCNCMAILVERYWLFLSSSLYMFCRSWNSLDKSSESQLSFPVSASSMNGKSQLRQSSRKDQKDSAHKDQGKSRSPDAGNLKKSGDNDENKEGSQTLQGKLNK